MVDVEDELAALERRLGRPDRPTSGAALACLLDLPLDEMTRQMLLWESAPSRVAHPVGGLRDAPVSAGLASPERAWEKLAAAGVIPASWRRDPRRAFTRELVHHPPDRHPGPSLATPGDLRFCIAAASDVDGVRRAEAQARRLCERLHVWGAPAVTTVLWRCAHRNDLGCVMGLLLNVLNALPSITYRGSELVRVVATWRAARGKRLGGDPRLVPEALRGRAVDELADVSEPLAALLATGYFVEGITAAEIVLGMPDIDE